MFNRWKDPKWTNNHIVGPLINAMAKHSVGLNPDATPMQAEFLAWVVDSIGHVSRYLTKFSVLITKLPIRIFLKLNALLIFDVQK